MATDPLTLYEIARPTTAPDKPASRRAAPAADSSDPLTQYEITPPSATAPSDPQPGGWMGTISDALGYGAGLVGSFTHGLSGGLDRPLNALTAGIFPNSSFA